ncbi:MAG: hypothetical protein GX102_07040 [Porphyromonadaceae bacterium]|nr:hypothetical protein [Porphyromonadaceae bacterium]
MKKIFFLAFSIFFGSALIAQTEYDALRISQSDIVGSARYMSMGGAFGALGGDASALKDNPAGLGVYRSGEISTTLNAMFQNSNSTWYNDKNSANSGLGVKFNNASYIMSIPLYQEKSSGLLQSNFSFGFNRVKNFNRVMRANGVTTSSFTDFVSDFTNQNKNGIEEADLKYVENTYEPYDVQFIPWMAILAYDGHLMNPDGATTPPKWSSAFKGQAKSTATMIETGGISEYSFGWGGNFNNNLFVGANLNIADLYYSLDTWLNEDFGSSSGDFTLKNRFNQTGMGVNLKLGAIYLPTNSLRLGLAFHTPTAFAITSTGYAEVDYNNVEAGKNGTAKTPESGSRQNFNINTPLQTQLSAAYLFGRKGLISIEYDFIHYTGNRFKERDGDNSNVNDPFEPENVGVIVDGKLVGGMKQVLSDGHVIKVGGEYKPTENVSLRAGYAMFTGGTNPKYTDGKLMRLNTTSTNPEYFEQKGANYFSLGLGYREATWFVDLAYALKMNNENYYPFQWNRTDLQPADIKTNTNNIVLTLGFKI